MEIWLAFLACWRLTSIIHSETIAAPLRKMVGGVEIISGEWVYPNTFIGYLFSCFWCLSVWVSGLCVAVLFICPYALYPFAISAVAIGIEELWRFVQRTQ